jgi:release factor glutamine methyltransferase
VTAEEEPATTRAAAQLDELIARRTNGEPLQYVLGCWLFRGMELMVDQRVLIPRPETEVTAQVAIEEAVRLGARRGRPDPWAGAATTYAVADLGTGSGALAIALASELPDAEVWGTDVSEDALAVARANLAGTGLPSTRVRLARGSWYDALPTMLRRRLRLVVSNPPYVAESELADLPGELHHEPRAALVSGATGMESIEQLAREAPAWLEASGTFVCEIAPHQAEAATKVSTSAGFEEVLVRPDLAGRDRVLVARMLG